MSRVDFLEMVEKKERVGDMSRSSRACNVCSRDERYSEGNSGEVRR